MERLLSKKKVKKLNHFPENDSPLNPNIMLVAAVFQVAAYNMIMTTHFYIPLMYIMINPAIGLLLVLENCLKLHNSAMVLLEVVFGVPFAG